MRFRSSTLPIVVLALSASVSPAASLRPLPFAPVETLTYNLTWSVFAAGQLVTTLSQSGGSAGDPYEIKAVARSRGFVSLLYQVHDEFHSVFDPTNMCSLRISRVKFRFCCRYKFVPEVLSPSAWAKQMCYEAP